MKRIYGIILLLVLIPMTVSAHELVVSRNLYKIKVEGQDYKSDNPILNAKNTTYLPLRELSNLFGKEINYQDGAILIEAEYPTTKGKVKQKLTELKVAYILQSSKVMSKL